MKKKNENLVNDAIKVISQNIAMNIEELKRLTENGEVTIDLLEMLMGELKSKNNEAVEKLYNELSNEIPEKELIRKKKQN